MTRAFLALVVCAALASGQTLDAGSAAKQARNARRAGDAEAALAILGRASPAGDPRVAGETIQALLDAGRADEALALAQRVDGSVATLPMVVAMLRVAALAGRHDEVLAGVDRNLRAAPQHVDLHALRARTLAELGRDAEAMAVLKGLPAAAPPALRTTLEIDLAHARGRREMADADMVERAVPRLERALGLDPDRVDVRVDYATALVRFNRNERAEEVVAEGLARAGVTDDERLSLTVARADACRSMDRLDEARAALGDVLDARPGDIPARLALARCDLRDGAYEPAIERLDAVLADSPDHLEAQLVRAELALLVDDGAGAERHLRAALDQRPRHLRAQYMLSRALRLAGKHAEAREVLEAYRDRKQALASG